MDEEDEEWAYDTMGVHGTKNADYYYSRVEGQKNFDHWFGGNSRFAAAASSHGYDGEEERYEGEETGAGEPTFDMDMDEE